MATFKQLQEALNNNCTIENAKENLKLLEAQKNKQEQEKKEYKETFNKLGVVLL